MRNPLRSRLWRNGAFARVWTAATVSISWVPDHADGPAAGDHLVLSLRSVAVPEPMPGVGGAGALAKAAAVVVEVERDQPAGG